MQRLFDTCIFQYLLKYYYPEGHCWWHPSACYRCWATATHRCFSCQWSTTFNPHAQQQYLKHSQAAQVQWCNTATTIPFTSPGGSMSQWLEQWGSGHLTGPGVKGTGVADAPRLSPKRGKAHQRGLQTLTMALERWFGQRPCVQSRKQLVSCHHQEGENLGSVFSCMPGMVTHSFLQLPKRSWLFMHSCRGLYQNGCTRQTNLHRVSAFRPHAKISQLWWGEGGGRRGLPSSATTTKMTTMPVGQL